MELEQHRRDYLDDGVTVTLANTNVGVLDAGDFII